MQDFSEAQNTIFCLRLFLHHCHVPKSRELRDIAPCTPKLTIYLKMLVISLMKNSIPPEFGTNNEVLCLSVPDIIRLCESELASLATKNCSVMFENSHIRS